MKLDQYAWVLDKTNRLGPQGSRPLLLGLGVIGILLGVVILAGWMVYVLVHMLIESKPVFTPNDVVLTWAKTFPHQPLMAAVLTTKEFRDGRTYREWVNVTQSLWTDVQFRRQVPTIQKPCVQQNL